MPLPPSCKTLSPVLNPWFCISILFASTSELVNDIGLINSLSNWLLYFTDTGVVVEPIPTARFGTTLILTISPFCNPWVVVFAAEIFVVTVLTTWSMSPITWLNVEVR